MSTRSYIVAEILAAVRTRPLGEFLVWLEAELEQARRSEREAEPITVGGVTLDVQLQVARMRGRAVRLTRAEARALACLMREHEQPVREEVLFREIAVHAGTNRKVVDVTMSHLRRKLREIGLERTISAVRSVGYLLRLRPAEPLTAISLPAPAESAKL